MRAESAQRRSPTRHHIESYAAAHRSADTSSPFTSGKINLSPAQFKGMYVKNPIRNLYQQFMRMKSPYKRH